MSTAPIAQGPVDVNVRTQVPMLPYSEGSGGAAFCCSRCGMIFRVFEKPTSDVCVQCSTALRKHPAYEEGWFAALEFMEQWFADAKSKSGKGAAMNCKRVRIGRIGL